MNDGRITITVTGTEATVASPFTARDTIKTAVPYWARRWDATTRRWIVDTAALRPLIAQLLAEGWTVTATDRAGRPWPPRPAPAPADPISAIFSLCPPDRIDKLRRALLVAFHPDHAGGDLATAQYINAVADRLTGRNTRTPR